MTSDGHPETCGWLSLRDRRFDVCEAEVNHVAADGTWFIDISTIPRM